MVAERTLAVVLAVLSLPIILAAAAVILCLSRRTPIMAHLRIGQYGKPFWMWKLRSMWGPGQRSTGCTWIERIDNGDVPVVRKGVEDPRVTSRFARFCRRHSIDELPQLWHVLTGRMTLVGPRPLTAQELDEHYGPAAAEVLRRKPGITGLWQVRGRNRLTYRQRRKLDLFLARRYSPALCCLILRDTVTAVLSGRDAS
jgi:lipopolysaccharide/colanic/teichoic acid biosynthesis glycosyltransferase